VFSFFKKNLKKQRGRGREQLEVDLALNILTEVAGAIYRVLLVV